MKDMHNYYYNMTTEELRVLRSKKHIRINRLRVERKGYFSQQELRKLTTQIMWIDAVLESRAAQKRMML